MDTPPQFPPPSAAAVLSNWRNVAADGKLHDEAKTAEMEALEMEVSYAVEHSRFTYNWVHVMLTTRVLDVLKTLLGHLNDIRPEGKYSDEGEIPRLTRFNNTLISSSLSEVGNHGGSRDSRSW
jgi:hypothetical protein